METPRSFQKNEQVFISRKITFLFAAFIIVTGASWLTDAPLSLQQTVDSYYGKQLIQFKEKLRSFKAATDQKRALTELKQKFFQSRLAYKKMALITEYFNTYESKFLNSPAIDRVEDDNPGKIIAPSGLQAVEQIIFTSWNSRSHKALSGLLDAMLSSVQRLEQEIDRANKFRMPLIWDAIRCSLVKITTMGITGFDSPVAFYSLPEAKASFSSIKEMLLIIRQQPALPDESAFNFLLKMADRAEEYLASHTNFNQFDRLAFITGYINPFYGALLKARKSNRIEKPGGAYPINFDAISIFSDNAFNIDFFSPGHEYRVTPERIDLGRRLFSDSILSGTNKRSCASCHAPEKAFTDGLKTPFELDQTTHLLRNTPTLWNSGFQTKQFADSRADILENQLDEVVHNDKEMRGSLKNSSEKLKSSPLYAQLFQQAYSKLKDPVNPFTIANAISSYLRSLVSINSRFDQYLRGNAQILTASEKNGFNLFSGKGKCATCHFMPLFNGLVPPVFSETESEILGVPETTDTVHPRLDPDLGKYEFTKAIIHKNAFKTPTLRNIELTAPYMHNGVYKTLEEVVNFYNKGGGKGLKIAPENQSLPFDRLNLSKKEILDLVHFMKSLTDTVYVSSTNH